MLRTTDENLLEMTDSYKYGHEHMRVERTLANFEYLAARKGAEFTNTILFGLQGKLKRHFVGKAFDQRDVYNADRLAQVHLGPGSFPIDLWQGVLDKHDGYLPLDIRAVPEGTPIPVGEGNALMSIQSTDDDFEFVAGWFESLLQQIWHPTTVATLSWHIRKMITEAVTITGGPVEAVDFMLHDFGFRSAANLEAAQAGGAGHLINSRGTDTIPALRWIIENYYDPQLACAGFSVNASEHNIMTQMGREGEYQVLDMLLDTFPTGILSVVIDSYDTEAFVDAIIERKDRILARDGKFVLRPDSTTEAHPTPALLSAHILRRLAAAFGTTLTDTKHHVLDPHVGLIWGDGLNYNSIKEILDTITSEGFAAHNMVFGMGGGLLHSNVQRDTQRFAIKSSAQKREDGWHDIKKETPGKTSMGGRLKLIVTDNGFETVRWEDAGENLLEPVFLNGCLLRDMTFGEVRRNAGWIKD